MNKINVCVVLAVMMAVCLGCQEKTAKNGQVQGQPETPTAAKKAELNIPDIIGSTAAETDAKLGTPTEVAGEYRDYSVDGLEKLQIKFKNDKAVEVVLLAEEARKQGSAEYFARQFGLDVKLGELAGSNAVKWSGSINGKSFAEIRALRSAEDRYFFSLTAKAE